MDGITGPPKSFVFDTNDHLARSGTQGVILPCVGLGVSKPADLGNARLTLVHF